MHVHPSQFFPTQSKFASSALDQNVKPKPSSFNVNSFENIINTKIQFPEKVYGPSKKDVFFSMDSDAKKNQPTKAEFDFLTDEKNLMPIVGLQDRIKEAKKLANNSSGAELMKDVISLLKGLIRPDKEAEYRAIARPKKGKENIEALYTAHESDEWSSDSDAKVLGTPPAQKNSKKPKEHPRIPSPQSSRRQRGRSETPPGEFSKDDPYPFYLPSGRYEMATDFNDRQRGRIALDEQGNELGSSKNPKYLNSGKNHDI